MTDFAVETQGFIDGTNTDNDYAYDANGNLTIDKNKKITLITYNLLNLPEEITFLDNSKIQYIYDASGAKLQKISTNATGTLLLPITVANWSLLKLGLEQAH